MIFHYTFDVPSVHFTSVRRKQKKGKTEVYAWTPLKLLLKYNHHNAKMHYQNKIYNYIIHNNNNSFFFTLFTSPNTQNWITRLYHRMNRVCSFVKPWVDVSPVKTKDDWQLDPSTVPNQWRTFARSTIFKYISIIKKNETMFQKQNDASIWHHSVIP